MSRKRIVIIAVLALIIAIGILLTSGHKDYSISATLNDEKITWYNSAEKALKHVKLEVVADKNDCEIDFEASKLTEISLTFTAQDSGLSFSGATNASNEASGVYTPDDDDENLDLIVWFTSETFEEGEVVLVEVTFDDYEKASEKIFGDKATTKYFAFTIVSSQ